MSATQDALLAATADIETAIDDLVTAYVAYRSSMADALSSAYTTAGGASNGIARKSDVENTVGMQRLNVMLAARLKALGLEGLFHDALAVTPTGAAHADWRTWLDARITALVP